MSFSTTVTLTDLNDFISLSQACTKPPEEKKNEVGIHEKKKVEITLGDCLACSGCITSAETVLIQQQSDKQVYDVLKNKKINQKTVVFSLSLQAISSLATKYNLEFQETSEKLCFFLKSIGVDYVYDISLARHLALYESQKDLVNRINLNEKNLKNGNLCLISSICPGFVCYAEKTHGELLVPLLSTVKSPQQIFGCLLKNLWSKLEKIDVKDIYHVSVMPCFDKKLEASRKEFLLENDLTEVDCVLTPVELLSMFEKEDFDFFNSDKKAIDNFWSYFIEDELTRKNFDNYVIKSHLGSSSGGYAENIYRMVSSALFNKKIDTNENLNFLVKRNKDFVELDLFMNEEVVFSVAIINGFRNIQTLIQRIKRGSCKYNYVEVMACPSGCINGGGLIKDISLEISKKLYSNLPKLSLEKNSEVFFRQFFENEETIKKYLHTKFNIIPKTKNFININW